VSVRSAGGQGLLRIDAEFRPIQVRRPGSVPVRVLSGPPGALAAHARTVVARLRPTSPPLPRIVGLTAVRRGRTLAVRWRTERPVRGANLLVEATATRAPGDYIRADSVNGHGRQSFRLRLDVGGRARYIQIFAVTDRDSTQRRVAIVRIAPG
jgi:hypothetical protein